MASRGEGRKRIGSGEYEGGSGGALAKKRGRAGRSPAGKGRSAGSSGRPRPLEGPRGYHPVVYSETLLHMLNINLGDMGVDPRDHAIVEVRRTVCSVH